MNEKMKDPMCVKKKVKIIPPEYSMENYIATFTPQKQLTPEQIFWSDDILKEMAKALKERANDPTQITAYQNLKERFGNNKSQPSHDAPEFDTVFEINKMKASLQGKDNIIRKLQVQISQLKETRSEADHTLDFRALDFQIT
ncbi:hypothetical protein Tco_0433184 [Tanacetum coccineum]